MLTAPLVCPDWPGPSDHPPSLSQQSTLPGYSGRPMAGSGISSWILWPIGAYLWKVPDLWIIIPFHWPGYQFYHLQNLCLPLGFSVSRPPSRHVISPNILSCRFLGLVPRLSSVVTHSVFNLCSDLIFTLILIIKLSHNTFTFHWMFIWHNCLVTTVSLKQPLSFGVKGGKVIYGLQIYCLNGAKKQKKLFCFFKIFSFSRNN